jgi:hypothetical protein
MAINRADAAPPLYMGAVRRILRDLAASASAPSSTNGSAADELGALNYFEFKRRLRSAEHDKLNWAC